MSEEVDVDVYARNPSGYDSFQRTFLSDPGAPPTALYEELFDCLALRSDQRVLEIGMGTGLNLFRYPRDAEIHGIDLSEEMLELARQRASELGMAPTLTSADASDVGYEDESFDAVVCTFVLCSCSAPGAIVEEAWRVCRPGGQVALFDYHRAPEELPGVLADQNFIRETMLRGIVFDGKPVIVTDPLYDLDEHIRADRWKKTFDRRIHESMMMSFRATILRK